MTTDTIEPIRKLYRRCKKGRHADCPGSFEAHSVCECDCHAGMQPAEVVEAVQAIVTAEPKPVIDLATMTEVKPKQQPTEGEARAKLRKFAAKRAKAAADFKPEPDGTYVNHPPRHEADYTMRGIKNAHAYAFFDPCDEHATEENAVIIAMGRSFTGSNRQVAANAISRCLQGCGECKERTRSALSAFARTQGDVEQAIAYKYPPKKSRPTRMSRETFIAKYDTGDGSGGVLLAGTYQQGDAVRSSINRCANRECTAMHNGMVVLHDTTELCGSCVLAGVKPRKRNK